MQVEFLELQGKQLELKTKNYSDQSEWTHTDTTSAVHEAHTEQTEHWRPSSRHISAITAL